MCPRGENLVPESYTKTDFFGVKTPKITRIKSLPAVPSRHRGGPDLGGFVHYLLQKYIILIHPPGCWASPGRGRGQPSCPPGVPRVSPACPRCPQTLPPFGSTIPAAPVCLGPGSAGLAQPGGGSLPARRGQRDVAGWGPTHHPPPWHRDVPKPPAGHPPRDPCRVRDRVALSCCHLGVPSEVFFGCPPPPFFFPSSPSQPRML